MAAADRVDHPGHGPAERIGCQRPHLVSHRSSSQIGEQRAVGGSPSVQRGIPCGPQHGPGMGGLPVSVFCAAEQAYSGQGQTDEHQERHGHERHQHHPATAWTRVLPAGGSVEHVELCRQTRVPTEQVLFDCCQFAFHVHDETPYEHLLRQKVRTSPATSGTRSEAATLAAEEGGKRAQGLTSRPCTPRSEDHPSTADTASYATPTGGLAAVGRYLVCLGVRSPRSSGCLEEFAAVRHGVRRHLSVPRGGFAVPASGERGTYRRFVRR